MRWIKLAGLALLAVAGGWWALQVALLEPNERSTASGYGQFALAILGILIIAAGPVRKAFSSGASLPVDELADLLALAMRNQWEKAARDRRLLEPAPLPIRWRRCRLPVAVPVAAATAMPARFDPFPGLAVTTPADLRSGDRAGLHIVYGGLPSGRLVIAGPAGSGKSAAAILLLLDSLRYRETHGSSVPVPVIFTLHGWDPGTTPLRTWLLTKLTEIPLLRKRGADTLLDAGKIAVFLDGLDEIPELLRPTALQALSDQADFRLVLLTRSAELVAAADNNPLLGAAALDLQPISPTDAADYLLRPLISPPPPAWQTLATTLTNNPASPLAQALNNPLTLTLLRDVGLTTDLTQFPTPDAIENHLLDHALIAAYAQRPGQPQLKYSRDTAQQTLGFIALRLNQAGIRDLKWWAIPGWIPTRRIKLVSGATRAIATGSLVGLGTWLTGSTTIGLVSGAVAGILAGAVAVSIARLDLAEPPKPKSWRLALFSVPTVIPVQIVVLYWVCLDREISWLSIVLVSSVVIILILTPTGKPARTISSDRPFESWRQSIVASYIQEITAAVAVFIMGCILGAIVNHGDLFGIPLATFTALIAAVEIQNRILGVWQMFITEMVITRHHHTPVRLMGFLEDARERGVLRTVGPVYQFRHAKLQDRLAGGPWAGDRGQDAAYG